MCKPSWSLSGGSDLSVISTGFDKVLHRVTDLQVHPNDPYNTYKFPGFCLSSGFNMHECWEKVSNKMHNSVGNIS